MNSALYQGTIVHARWKPVMHRFRYEVFQWLLDLDELPAISKRLSLFSYNRPNVTSVLDRDYLDAEGAGLPAAVRHFVAASGVTAPVAKIFALTNARVFGYVFNPVSWFYCYDSAGSLLCIVAEVNNTFGDSHRYVLDHRTAATPGPGPWPTEPGAAHEAWKLLHVSPFASMQCRYRFEFPTLPDARTGSPLEVRMEVNERGGKFFRARLQLKRVALDDLHIAFYLLRFPFITASIITQIHWQALRIKLKGAPFHHRPKYDPALVLKSHERESFLYKS